MKPCFLYSATMSCADAKHHVGESSVFTKISPIWRWSFSSAYQVCFVSHQEHPTGHSCKRTKTAGTPVKTPSPWMVSNISFSLYNVELTQLIILRGEDLNGEAHSGQFKPKINC
ncbi:hypothetical protein THOD03_230008 [Vibrio harveyi]|nr:hypothetical protein THOD03_230008 [Vibrio harveyi]